MSENIDSDLKNGINNSGKRPSGNDNHKMNSKTDSVDAGRDCGAADLPQLEEQPMLPKPNRCAWCVYSLPSYGRSRTKIITTQTRKGYFISLRLAEIAKVLPSVL